MRFGDEPESSNFEDATGRSGMGFGGGGGNALGCLLPLVASRFGIGGVIVLVIGYFLLSSLGGLGGGGGGGGGSLAPTSQQSAPAGQSTLDPNTRHFMLQVLGSTEKTWNRLLGGRYTPTTLVAYSRSYQSGCGAAQSAMGPFYCPTDKKIYLDTEFFNELSQRFQAPGDFAEAYVIAHEVGHHVQDLTGTLDQAHNLQARSGETEGNAIQVKVELQADCYAGVWAKNAKDPEGRRSWSRATSRKGCARRKPSATIRYRSNRRASSSLTASPTARPPSAWRHFRKAIRPATRTPASTRA